jgi:hypothetical protein
MRNKTKLTYKNIRLASIVVGALFVAYIFFSIIRVIIVWFHTLDTRAAILRTIPIEYLHLFHFQDNGMIKNEFTQLSTVRHPISNFDYDSNKYCIIVTKIDIERDIPLNEMIEEEYKATTLSPDVGYLGAVELKFDFEYLTDSVKASKVHLNIEGDEVTTIVRNDTIASYYLKMKSLSVQYKNDGLNDLVGTAKRDNIPTAILFLKRKKELYFILMSVNYNDPLNPNLLYSLVIGSPPSNKP